MTRYLCIHGHFYQPPREDPWTGEVEEEVSAHPYHDWNERITAECYEPNLGARILDPEGRIALRLNNYSKMSFNFGPTLLSWLERKAGPVYQAILDSDRRSRKFFSGHGSALAQGYNHLILPLANRRDQETQVRWGRKDFEFRFGRSPEGMWLPETAVDLETLECLAAEGIRFTLLAPHQAKRFREGPSSPWIDCTKGGLDLLRPYRIQLPSGRSLVLFFYEGKISQEVAFQRLLRDGETFLQRLAARFDARPEPQLLHIATDGETYGHHHKFGEMALAYVLHAAETRGLAKLANYGEFLALHPPTAEVEIVENSSWSCVHGVARWSSDCGCRVAAVPGWNQAWRGPLRHALDELRDHWAAYFERDAANLLRDPWAARNDYIEILLDPSPERRREFFRRHGRFSLTEADCHRAAGLLELQRHAMLMFTSCGWFFDDPSGLETRQVLNYARRGLQLARELGAEDREPPFLEQLRLGHSNLPEQGSLRDIFLSRNIAHLPAIV
ncbi:MAG: DUF3536 domain-containing protein [bacterium]